MNKKIIITAFLLAAGLFATRNAQAQRTYEEMERLTVNEQVTTVITASEPVRFVDISTDKVAGDQPIENIIRLKPKETGHEDGEVLAIVTIVTERYRTQYALIYTTRISEAVADKEIQLQERDAYNNPTVSMSTADMVRFARRVELARENPQRGDQGAPNGDAPEQYLLGGRLLLHRLFHREQNEHPFRHRRDTGETVGQETFEGN